MSDLSIPSKEEVAELPRWARVAFAARCARRVLPLYKHHWPNAPIGEVDLLGRAVGYAEQAAIAAVSQGLDTIAADAWHSGERAARQHAEFITFDPYPYNTPPIRVARSVANALWEEDRGREGNAYWAAADAAVAAPATVGAIRSDFDRLAAIASSERWTDASPVPPSIFGPLWPDGPPAGWPEDEWQQTHLALKSGFKTDAVTVTLPPIEHASLTLSKNAAASSRWEHAAVELAPTADALPASERGMTQPLEPGAPVFGTPDSHWNLVQLLGEGGFGQVWLASNGGTCESRAVKFFTHPARRTEHAKHEMTVVRHVLKHMREHPETLANIVPLLDANLNLDPPWLMYRYVPGGRCLSDVIREGATLSLPNRLHVGLPLLRTVATAVGRMHRLKLPIVHRDLKPSNVLMDGDTPMISDFGIGGASVIGAIWDSTGGLTTVSADIKLLTHLHMSGTPVYACPQQLDGAEPDPRDDVFSLAVIAFQLVLGDRKARPGTDARDTLEEIGLSNPLAKLIARNLSSNPAKRQVDAAEFAQELA